MRVHKCNQLLNIYTIPGNMHGTFLNVMLFIGLQKQCMFNGENVVNYVQRSKKQRKNLCNVTFTHIFCKFFKCKGFRQINNLEKAYHLSSR